MLHGPLTRPENQQVRDLTVREVITLAPLIILFFVIGLFPNLFFDKINPSAQAVADAVNRLGQSADTSAISMTVDK